MFCLSGYFGKIHDWSSSGCGIAYFCLSVLHALSYGEQIATDNYHVAKWIFTTGVFQQSVLDVFTWGNFVGFVLIRPWLQPFSKCSTYTQSTTNIIYRIFSVRFFWLWTQFTYADKLFVTALRNVAALFHLLQKSVKSCTHTIIQSDLFT